MSADFFFTKTSKTPKSASTEYLNEQELMTAVRSLLAQDDADDCADDDSCDDYDKSYRPGINSDEPLGKYSHFEVPLTLISGRKQCSNSDFD